MFSHPQRGNFSCFYSVECVLLRYEFSIFVTFVSTTVELWMGEAHLKFKPFITNIIFMKDFMSSVHSEWKLIEKYNGRLGLWAGDEHSFVRSNVQSKNICSWKQPKRKYLSWLKLNRKQWPINTYSNWNWQYLFNWFEMVRSKVFGASSARFKSNWKAKVYRGTNCKMIFLKIKGEESNKSGLRKNRCIMCSSNYTGELSKLHG